MFQGGIKEPKEFKKTMIHTRSLKTKKSTQLVSEIKIGPEMPSFSKCNQLAQQFPKMVFLPELTHKLIHLSHGSISEEVLNELLAQVCFRATSNNLETIKK